MHDPFGKKPIEFDTGTNTSNDIGFNLEISQTFRNGVQFEIDFPISWRVFSIAMALACLEKPCKKGLKIAVAKHICCVDAVTIKTFVQDETVTFTLDKSAQAEAAKLRAGDIIKIEYEDKFGQRFASDITKLF